MGEDEWRLILEPESQPSPEVARSESQFEIANLKVLTQLIELNSPPKKCGIRMCHTFSLTISNAPIWRIILFGIALITISEGGGIKERGEFENYHNFL